MNFRGGGRRARQEPTLDLTPLIDAVFLLLIFFLVTATFSQRDRSVIPIDLPAGSTGSPVNPTAQLSLIVRPDGSVVFQSADGATEEVAADALRARLQALHAENPDLPLHLRGDRNVRYGAIMEVLDVIRATGFRRVFNVVERPAAATP